MCTIEEEEEEDSPAQVFHLSGRAPTLNYLKIF
jgi:hypothetical protein